MEFRLNPVDSSSVSDLESLKKEHAEFKKARAEVIKAKEKHAKSGDEKLIESMNTYIAQLDKLIKTVETEIEAAAK